MIQRLLLRPGQLDLDQFVLEFLEHLRGKGLDREVEAVAGAREVIVELGGR